MTPPDDASAASGASALDDDQRTQLAALPVDLLASRRLNALCALQSAHDELTARVRAPKPYKLDLLPPVRRRRRG
jgi:hypothetical protein